MIGVSLFQIILTVIVLIYFLVYHFCVVDVKYLLLHQPFCTYLMFNFRSF